MSLAKSLHQRRDFPRRGRNASQLTPRVLPSSVSVGTLSGVGASASELESRQGASKGTLGDILYADKGKSPVPEADWVALVRAIAARDQAAFHSLYQRTHRIVFTLIVRITKDREVAEEVTLDVFHDVWRRASTYDPANGSVVGWIANQARSRAIDRLRYEHRKKRTDPYPHDAITETEASPDEVLSFREQYLLLRKALVSLTDNERRAIETAFFSDLTHAEVAALLDEPLGTIKTRIRSGLEKLRHALAGVKKQ